MPINELETEELIIPKEGITILDFFAPWCAPCKQMEPVMKDLGKDDINIIKINTDKLPKIAADYQITSIPAIFIYKDGELKDMAFGVVSAKTVYASLLKIDAF